MSITTLMKQRIGENLEKIDDNLHLLITSAAV